MKIPFLKLSGAALLVLGPALSGCASDPASPSPGLLQKIESARTRSAHEELVAHYANKAGAASAAADRHREMARSYQGNLGAGRGMPSMPAHCRGLVASFEAAAIEHEGAMIVHRQLAEQAKGS